MREDSVLVKTVLLAENESCRSEKHGTPEIGVVTDGSGTFTVLSREIPCRRGDIFVVGSGVEHSYTADSNLSVAVINFDPGELFDAKRADRDDAEYCFGVFCESPIVTCAMLNSHTLSEVMYLFGRIGCEIGEKQREWQIALCADMTLLLITVGRYVRSAVKTIDADLRVRPKDWITVSSAMSAVSERFADPDMTLASIAESLYTSQSTLSRMFRKLTGVPFSEYVQNIRLETAAGMLADTQLSVEEIAGRCGIRDVPSFYRAFRRRMGISPNTYRKNEKENNKLKEQGEIKMQILADISENLQKGKAKIVKELVQQAIDAGASPEEILNKGLLDGMNIIGEKFKKNEVYVPEVLVAARAMNMGTQVLKPYLMEVGVEAAGRVCIGTVQGDLHDIGKNLVKMMMEGKGLEVIDLGTDVSPETFVNTAIEQNCQVICCSALLTTTMDVMADVVKAAEAAGIRDKVKIMVGGAPVTDEYCRQIGADKYTSDAASAADAALEFCRGM